VHRAPGDGLGVVRPVGRVAPGVGEGRVHLDIAPRARAGQLRGAEGQVVGQRVLRVEIARDGGLRHLPLERLGEDRLREGEQARRIGRVVAGEDLGTEGERGGRAAEEVRAVAVAEGEDRALGVHAGVVVTAALPHLRKRRVGAGDAVVDVVVLRAGDLVVHRGAAHHLDDPVEPPAHLGLEGAGDVAGSRSGERVGVIAQGDELDGDHVGAGAEELDVVAGVVPAALRVDRGSLRDRRRRRLFLAGVGVQRGHRDSVAGVLRRAHVRVEVTGGVNRARVDVAAPLLAQEAEHRREHAGIDVVADVQRPEAPTRRRAARADDHGVVAGGQRGRESDRIEGERFLGGRLGRGERHGRAGEDAIARGAARHHRARPVEDLERKMLRRRARAGSDPHRVRGFGRRVAERIEAQRAGRRDRTARAGEAGRRRRRRRPAVGRKVARGVGPLRGAVVDRPVLRAAQERADPRQQRHMGSRHQRDLAGDDQPTAGVVHERAAAAAAEQATIDVVERVQRGQANRRPWRGRIIGVDRGGRRDGEREALHRSGVTVGEGQRAPGGVDGVRPLRSTAVVGAAAARLVGEVGGGAREDDGPESSRRLIGGIGAAESRSRARSRTGRVRGTRGGGQDDGPDCKNGQAKGTHDPSSCHNRGHLRTLPSSTTPSGEQHRAAARSCRTAEATDAGVPVLTPWFVTRGGVGARQD
jgi:hypothetical protein